MRPPPPPVEREPPGAGEGQRGGGDGQEQRVFVAIGGEQAVAPVHGDDGVGEDADDGGGPERRQQAEHQQDPAGHLRGAEERGEEASG